MDIYEHNKNIYIQSINLYTKQKPALMQAFRLSLLYTR